MFRKLIALALVGAGVAAVLRKRKEATPSPAQPFKAGSESAGAGQGAGAEAGAPETPAADDLAEVRSGQTEATVQAPIQGAGGDEEAAIPDVSAEDPVVREQERAAAEEAGSIGGSPDSATADTDPSMRPVYEGSGGDPETFETTDEQGR